MFVWGGLFVCLCGVDFCLFSFVWLVWFNFGLLDFFF